jgi:hypothetical protein
MASCSAILSVSRWNLRVLDSYDASDPRLITADISPVSKSVYFPVDPAMLAPDKRPDFVQKEAVVAGASLI